MKKEVVFIALMFSFFGSYAQSYIPFPETNAKWVSNILYIDPQSKGGDYCYDSYIETDGDTMINNLKYIKLIETKIKRIYVPFVCLGIDTAAPIDTSFFGWMRNDSLNKKVYLRRSYMSKDTLLYDFDLQIGDTLSSTYLFYNNWTSYPYTVNLIKQLNIGGVNRNVYVYSYGSHSRHDSLIEGIGSFYGSNGMNIIPTSNFGINYTLLCMIVSGIKVYPPNGSCPLITSIDEEKVDDADINLFPNPTSNHFKIEKPDLLDVETAVLTDFTGRVIKRFQNNIEVYNVEELPPGVYIFRFKTYGRFYSKKIVIQ